MKMNEVIICHFKKVFLTQRSGHSEWSHHKTQGMECRKR